MFYKSPYLLEKLLLGPDCLTFTQALSHVIMIMMGIIMLQNNKAFVLEQQQLFVYISVQFCTERGQIHLE